MRRVRFFIRYIGLRTFGRDTAPDEGECEFSPGPDEAEVEGQLEGGYSYAGLQMIYGW